MSGVLGKITEIFNHREARADQGPVDDTISYIVKFVTQDDEEQQQPDTFERFLGDAGVESLKNNPYDFAAIVGV